ncbi:CRISPR-associated protein Cas4 [Acetivibrio saccincola]|jgi:CRISPR-associated exonuclease Cas4|uniref:CRISPR-associated exonuclease Cas4 n=1 Tax=Acetivibrio saccincola TaxID=1677857 RepID=A0A2K9DZK3_9FIRM|nr:CRISPR-associated protein Cas4 [Acetivibrio saccincola]AUG56932.1 PD-(D/E)XK nuclease superfamily protein [Acetivibrio saccincola]NLW27916.1 CRISPR-associated protein Cas4 [Acetivibrio saccincola]PQQ66956.1 CRISPR-associated protein Cas4 [Acetivibrio saccincola]HOA96821.1 CRISPR-associated protein Cas4 [Acetivibrio saccincola]HQD29591.1 CRISPR-associated protein Cas4 [Acetivibrio saccincola]
MEGGISGTLIWYYYICKREVWLISRALEPDQEDENIVIGKFIHENSYSREKKELDFGNIKVDITDNKDGSIIVQEIKKSSKFIESARMQLLFYLYEIRKTSADTKGILLIPEEKKREEVILDEESEEKLEKAIEDIKKIVSMEKPPKAEKIKYCRNCAYSEMCWA